MPVALRGVCLLSAFFLCVVTVLAVAPCDQQIIDNLKKHPVCYWARNLPLIPSPATLRTHVITSKDDLPADAYCMKSLIGDEKASLFYQLRDSVPVYRESSVSFNQEVQGDHILQTGPDGVKYKLYVMHNKYYVFSYYRCIDGDTGGTGDHEVQVALDCTLRHGMGLGAYMGRQAQYVVDTALACFSKLGLNRMGLPQCPC